MREKSDLSGGTAAAGRWCSRLSRAARDCADRGVDLDVGGTGEALVGMHLFALIPGQGASQLLRQLADVLGKRSNNSRRVLAGDLHDVVKRDALDEGSDVRVVRSGKKVSFPMPRYSAILNLGGPLADRDHIEDMPLSPLRVVALGVPHPPRSTQLRRQLLFQHAADSMKRLR